METLNSYNFVLFVVTQMILMFTIPALISGIKYSKLDYFFIIVITSLSLFLYKMFDSASLIILTSFIHYIVFRQNQMVFYFVDYGFANYFVLC